jgi:hypothetical protein
MTENDPTARDRVLNFLANWIDANIVHASHEPDSNPSTMQYRFLTDALAAGLTLDNVNEEWPGVEIEVRRALSGQFSK